MSDVGLPAEVELDFTRGAELDGAAYRWAHRSAAEIKRLRKALERIEREGAGLWLGQLAADALDGGGR